MNLEDWLDIEDIYCDETTISINFKLLLTTTKFQINNEIIKKFQKGNKILVSLLLFYVRRIFGELSHCQSKIYRDKRNYY